MFICRFRCTKARSLGIGLLKKLIAKAGLTNKEYLDLFYER